MHLAPSIIFADEAVLHRHQERITTAAASKAKRQILGHSLQHQASQYEMLPACASLLLETNPGTYVKLAVDRNTKRFQRIFICPPTSSKSFVHCRPFIAVDGTFTKTQFIQTLLLAVGIDADNHAVLLAWALVESETEDSWRFFLTNLKSTIPTINSSHVTLMSDRDKGLAAASTELPETKRAHCIQHLAENVGKTYRKEARDLFRAISCSLTLDEYEANLQRLQEHSAPAAQYVNSLNRTKYCAPFFPSRTYGHLTSNIVESVNNSLLDERALPCLELLDAIWHKLMHLRFERNIDSKIYPKGQKFTSYGQNLLRGIFFLTLTIYKSP